MTERLLCLGTPQVELVLVAERWAVVVREEEGVNLDAVRTQRRGEEL